MLNIALVLSVALCLLLLIANATALKNGAFSSIFAYEVGGFAVTEWLLGYAKKYAWDMLLLGILVAFTFKGNKSGFLATLRVLLVNIGSIAAVAACLEDVQRLLMLMPPSFAIPTLPKIITQVIPRAG